MTDTDTPAATPWYASRLTIGLAGLLVGLAAGTGIGASLFTADPESTGAYISMEKQLDTAQAKVDRIDERARELDSKEADVASDRQLLGRERDQLDKDTEDLADREKAVGIAEKEREANTVGGSGVFEVGKDMRPGRYKSSGGSSCYFAVLRSTDSADIVTNGLPGGQTFATVAEGQYFETRDCGEWVKQ